MIAELLVGLALSAPAAAYNACPVTTSTAASRRYGGRRLWVFLPARGVLKAQRNPDGTLGQKLAWIPDRFRGDLTVQGRRVGGTARMRVLGVNWGYASTGKGSWRTAVTFPAPGCWRLTGQTAGQTLSYVVKVVPA